MATIRRWFTGFVIVVLLGAAGFGGLKLRSGGPDTPLVCGSNAMKIKVPTRGDGLSLGDLLTTTAKDLSANRAMALNDIGVSTRFKSRSGELCLIIKGHSTKASTAVKSEVETAGK